MEHLLRSLNPSQREAVTTTRGPVLVLAGAGTGKTSVITHRMAYLIASGAAPHQVLALTFTNKAAREMKERFAHLASGLRPPDELKQLTAGTFHSFCVRVLRQFIDRLEYKRNFAIIASSEQVGIMKEVLGACGIQPTAAEANKFIALVSRAKNRGLVGTNARDDSSAARVWKRYDETLKSRNALDFDDLLLKTLELLRDHDQVRDILRERIRFILVDEYQDTNRLQFDIVRRLASDQNDICVVGDDDQSIYSWRGADSSHILEFADHFPGARIVKLEQNYRCTPTILKAANAVIRNNARRHGKQLWADGLPGDAIRLLAARTDQHEADWVVGDLQRARDYSHLRWEDAAILYRANHLSRIFEQTLRTKGIPYRVVGGQEFYERREVKDVLAFLAVCLDPNDDINLLRILNVPARGIGKTAATALLQQSKVDNRSVWQEIESAMTTGITGRAATGIASFRLLINEYREKFTASTNWGDTLRALLDDIGYPDEIRRTSKDAEEAASRLENIAETITALDSFQLKGEGDLRAFLDAMLLRDTEDPYSKNKKEKDDVGVSLMTLHAAKGLEFSRVYLVGVEEGVLPHDRVKMEGNVDEERRLFYVGITRAKHVLSLSHCTTRKRYGQDEPCQPSSFLSELPEDVLNRECNEFFTREVAHDEVADHFAAFRARLGS